MKIEQIELFIANFEHTITFYQNQLEWKLLDRNEEIARFQVGESVIVLHQDEESGHYYHFALNIPPNLFQSAKRWVHQRIALSTEDGDDEANFTEFKADAFYFEDPAGNIIEYIARYTTIPNAMEQEFSPQHVLGVSEIGVSSHEVKTVVEKIINMGIPTRNNEQVYESQFLNFMGEAADGNYIIVGPVGRRWIFSEKLGVAAPVIIHTDRGIFRYTA